MAVIRHGSLALAAADLHMRSLASANDHTTMLPKTFDHLCAGHTLSVARNACAVTETVPTSAGRRASRGASSPGGKARNRIVRYAVAVLLAQLAGISTLSHAAALQERAATVARREAFLEALGEAQEHCSGGCAAPVQPGALAPVPRQRLQVLCLVNRLHFQLQIHALQVREIDAVLRRGTSCFPSSSGINRSPNA
jgi:hypothetical protein